LVSATGVGKSSISARFLQGTFSPHMGTTIGAAFGVKRLVYNGMRLGIQLWDTAGQERYRALTQLYYRDSKAIVLVYDITNRQSFVDIEHWLREISLKCPEAIVHIVGSKVDLHEQRVIDIDYANQMIARWRARIKNEEAVSNEPGQPSSIPSSRSNSNARNRHSMIDDSGINNASRLAFTGWMAGRKSDEEERRRSEEASDQEAFENCDVEVTEVSARNDEGKFF
ncbi:ras-domain-containing protein, partial [Atractiella rhizophila]